ncbi:MAG: A/G-specific adenine glycosylase [Clostridiales bacterium]|nr:A/G-specific adenine glycosylase [Clostridiales bacterium]
MKYDNITRGIFLDRPNRFIAHVELSPGNVETVHVKNTGRCRELLIPGREVILTKSGNPARKTQYDLICVNKEGCWVNIDSQAPNQAAAQWLEEGNYFPEPVQISREKVFGNSRFDLYVESERRKAFIEVKGVTLEEEDIVRFPDAPTLRGVKHLEELIRAVSDGYEAYILFVIQMHGVRWFAPNWDTHREFGETLKKAAASGVKILAFECQVSEDELWIRDPVPVFLEEEPDPEGFVSPLLAWYQENKRILPWRDQKNPYYTWVSEIMLQQTRVETVKPYFVRFIQELPDVAALAAVPHERLMKLWEGLGYYSRARNMQEAAVTVMERYHGQMPSSYEELRSLKGIGDYTAGAIASIAFGVPVPAVDGNVLRVFARMTDTREDIGKQSVRREITRAMAALIPKDCPGDFNQAMMELGAVLCLPGGQARCRICPVCPWCLAYHRGTVESLPHKAPKKERKIEEKTVLVIRDGDRTVIRRRPEMGLLAGLYELPNTSGYLTREGALEYVEGLNLVPLRIEELPDAKHIFSHIEWRMKGYRIAVSSLEKTDRQDLIFVKKEQSEREYPIPSAFGAYLRYMKEEEIPL